MAKDEEIEEFMRFVAWRETISQKITRVRF
jgi:hypothetical protein